MAEDQAQKTEPATPRKRDEARNKGQVAQSRDLQSLAVLAGGALVLGATGASLIWALDATMRRSFGAIADAPSTSADFFATLIQAMMLPSWALVPCFVGVPVAAALVQFAHVGPLFSFEALAWQPERLDPFQGLLKLVKPDRWVDLVKTLAKVGLISLTAWWAFRSDLPLVLGLAGASLGDSLSVLGSVILRVVAAVLGVIAIIAVADVMIQGQRHEKQLRMTQREVREDLKQAEGDPQIRSRHRSRQQELSRTRMIAAVASADVVVTNPTHFAVALQYDRASMAAPHVVAKGKGHVALRIREAAERAGVPVMEDAPLARVLHKTCEIGREVPKNLFQAVAELLALVYRLQAERRAGA